VAEKETSSATPEYIICRRPQSWAGH